MKEVSRWWSPRLECDVTVARWGHWGMPVLLFPTAGGDADEFERMDVIGALWPLIEAGADQGLFLRQRRRAGLDLEARLRGLLRAAAKPLRRVRRTRAGAGDPDRLPVRGHRDHDRRRLDRRLQRRGVAVPPPWTCSRRRSG